METVTKLDSELPNEVLIENSSNNASDVQEMNATIKENEEEELKEEEKPDSLEEAVENRSQCDTETSASVTTSIANTLPESYNAAKAEEKMEIESPAANNDTESKTEPLSLPSQDTPVQPTDAVTPKTSDKKSKTRPSSESSQTPTANKVAKLTPRATRSSQNPDFAAKQRKFLNRVHDPIRCGSDSENSQGSTGGMKGTKENKPKSVERKTPVLSDSKRKLDKDSTPKRLLQDSDDEGSVKKRKIREPTKVVGGRDSYCWRCHRDGVEIHCNCGLCHRAYHVKCVQLDKPPEHPGWMCPECSLITKAEDCDTRSRAMRMLTLDQLCNMLRFALNRMKDHEGAEDFAKPVDAVQFPLYRDYIVKPMDLSQLERNIKQRLYGSTEAFLADAKWIVHNSIIFNSVQSKFTNTARALLKLCRQEMQHIENCPDCYQNSHIRSSDSWFTEACRRPHILVWAKLKGYPFWPAKVMYFNSENNQVDIRFFGQHDRAWIPLNQCFLYSKLSPTPSTNNKNKLKLEESLEELEYHVKKLQDKFGHFEYASYKTPYDPKKDNEQLLMMLPQYETRTLGKRSRVSLHHDGARKSLVRRPASPVKHPSQHTPAQHTEQQSPAAAEKSGSVETPTDSTPVNGVTAGELPVELDEEGRPMVFIPKMSNRTTESSSPGKYPNRATPSTEGESEPDRSPPNKQNGTPVLKKKTPLTAAAKKCFAMIKKDKRSSDPNSTVRGIVTVQREQAVLGETDQPAEEMAKSADMTGHDQICVENLPEISQSETAQTEADSEVPASRKDSPEGKSGAVESPPKFVIHKGLESDSHEPKRKTSIVDKLQQKLCTTVIEALKDQMTPEEVEEIEQEKEVESSPEKVTDEVTTAQEPQAAVVVLHRLSNDKEMMAKLGESDVNITAEKSKDIVEVQSPSEVGSEVETDVSSCGESDITVVAQESSKRKKKNINNVVQNLKERKSSVDEQSENKKENGKESNAVMLDDSVEESPILVIDESESSDSKTSGSGKSDKNRRKGIPAKVHSRSHSSSTSTESCETENRLSKSGSLEVLDETSGHFRPVENDRPVTITVVTDDNKPQKKTGKEIRSVNISKSLSLSLIKDSAGLQMECVGSDVEDQVIVDSVRKVLPRVTARKTMPNRPHPPKLLTVDKRPSSVPPAGIQNPPPLVSLRQTKPSGPTKPAQSPTPLPRSLHKPSPRAEVGPAHAKVEEIIQKTVAFMRATFEEWLNVSSETNGENVEALKQVHQLELERIRWQQKQEIAELKYNTDLIVKEMRQSWEAEKQRTLLDVKHKLEMEKEQSIQETKKKQWCAFCQKEAQLYCCWNTAYCSEGCQKDHWMSHINECRNTRVPIPEEVVPPHRPTGVPAYPQVGYNS